MESITLNDELTLTYPEGFRVLTQDEMDSMQFLEKGPGTCLSDPERHILISVGWKRPGVLAGLMLNAGDLAKNSEKTIRKAMQNMGYRCRGFEKREIAGNRAEGFGFEYSAQGVEMLGETYVMKIGKTIYYLNFYTRRECETETAAVWEQILETIKRRK